ncbi:MAG: DUF523 domain-containing protein [Proteobacteria bacterium]|nr:DUF523 domain-containing protein [Pseudomonadota bacterium]MBU1687747.1 DUF523 domain-containing protein [Pseudomonadota bacterium]
MKPIILVSACLVGLFCRYDGRTKPSDACLEALHGAVWIPFCPEQLGGLPTPRPPADLVGGDGDAVLAGQAQVMTRSGVDVTKVFVRGAYQTLDLAGAQKIAAIFMKGGSPSCGCGVVLGVTAALLKSSGYILKEF